jgi:hypothetical protein
MPNLAQIFVLRRFGEQRSAAAVVSDRRAAVDI